MLLLRSRQHFNSTNMTESKLNEHELYSVHCVYKISYLTALDSCIYYNVHSHHKRQQGSVSVMAAASTWNICAIIQFITKILFCFLVVEVRKFDSRFKFLFYE